jgi:CrcB protein
MKAFWSVAIGAALGGLARYYLGGIIQDRSTTDFPVGTLAINVAGSFLVGVVLRLALRSNATSETLRLFLATGFGGGFTTFSAFSYETVTMIQSGRSGRAAGYVGASIGLALIATYAGFLIADAVVGS